MQRTKHIIITIIVIGLGTFANLQAATIKGKVTDKNSGEELVGCAVYISELNLGTTTGFDGTYELKNVPEGSHTLQIRYITYESQTRKLSISAGSPSITINFELLPTSETLSEVLVVSQMDRSTDKSARSTEKNANQIVNVVSAKSIELSPDLNVAAVLQRMSGVTMEKNSSGEAQYAILRGMDKRYNYTLVNGVKLSSPDNKYRYLPLDIFPSEILDRIEVTKSLTADMEADATGGVVNLVMKDAPTKFMLQANMALGYNTHFFNNEMSVFPTRDVTQKSPREMHGSDYVATMDDFNKATATITNEKPLPNATVGLAIGNRFLSNKLGFVLAGNYQNDNKGNTSVFFEDYMEQNETNVRLSEMQYRHYSENQTRYGVHSKVDFRINPLHKIELYNAYVGLQNAQVREVESFNLAYYFPESGDLDLSYKTRVRSQSQNIFNSTLQGTHQLGGKFKAEWSLVFSKATNRLPDNNQIYLDQLIQDSIPGSVYVDADGSNRRWEHNSDQDYTALVHFTRDSYWGMTKLSFKAGGLFREKSRENDYVNYRFKPLNHSQVQGKDFETLDEINWTLDTPYGSVNPLVYDASETTTATYFNAIATGRKWRTGVGVRAEYTQQGYHMYYPKSGDAPDSHQSHLDIFPSFQLRFSPTEQTNWKLSYFRSINRSGFFEIVPYTIINEDYTEHGNPDLKSALIDNADLRWEYFPSTTEQLMVGLFYKMIKDPIEYAYWGTNRSIGYRYQNMDNATNFGAEIDIIKFFRQFGFKVNYTFTHSSITTPKSYRIRDANGNTKTMSVDQKRPLVGQAMHVANLSLMYKNTNHGLDAQLAASYTGEKMDIVSQFLDSDFWQRPSYQLDASAEKKLTHGFSLFAKVNNIIQSPKMYIKKMGNVYNDKFPRQESSTNSTLLREDKYGTTFLVGVRFKH